MASDSAPAVSWPCPSFVCAGRLLSSRAVKDTFPRTIAVQVDGKLRGTIDLSKDCDPKVAEDKALRVESVIAAIGDKKPSRIIVVPNRIVNVVV